MKNAFLSVVDGNSQHSGVPTKAAIETILPQMEEFDIPKPPKWSAEIYREIEAKITLWSLLRTAELAGSRARRQRNQPLLVGKI